jgi:UDP-4-amino-4,6-dideoxy-N-acetyl-beta-L-altrosamine transaminase
MTAPGRKPLSYGRQDVSVDDVQAVVECLQGDFLTQGPRVALFEDGLRAATGARHAVAVANGTAALHLAYLAMGLGPGDVGVTTPISFVATSNGLLYAGASVAFADVDASTGLVRPDALEGVVDQLTREGRPPKVITPVDLAGQPTDRAAVLAIARKCGARVLEDAAHSLGATYSLDGTTHRVGGCAHADAAILSFHPVKHVTTGEGGAILTNDDELHRRLLDLRTHGIHKDAARMQRAAADPFAGPWYYEQNQLGFNYRITDMQCALGASQLSRLPAFVARRQQIAALYDGALAREPLSAHLAPARRLGGRTHAHHLYVVQVRPRSGEDVKDTAARRKALYVRLAEQRIHCQVHYIPIPWQPYYVGHPLVVPGTYPEATLYYASSLSIPMYPSMTDDDVAVVIGALEEACAAG